MKKSIIIVSAALLAVASTAFAQSTVCGTLGTGGSSSGLCGTVVPSGDTLTGTVTPSDSTLTGTVVTPPATGGGTSGGGGGGGGSTPPIIDYCSNIDGIQSTLAGYVVQNGTCVLSGATGTGGVGGGGGGEVLGASTETPGVPNTGAGGGAGQNLLLLTLSGLAALAAGGYLWSTRRRVV